MNNDTEAKDSKTNTLKFFASAWVVLVIFAVLIELPVLNDPLYRDDHGWLRGAREAPENLHYIYKFPFQLYYRPAALSLMTIEYALFGPSPVMFRIATLVMHAGIIGLLLALTFRLTGNRTAAVLAGFAFVINPGHGEAVWWISAQPGVLAALAGLACCVLYYRLRDKGSRWAAGGVFATAAIALLSKEEAYPLIFILLILDRTVHRNRSETNSKRPGLRYGVLGAIGAMTLAIVVYSLIKNSPLFTEQYATRGALMVPFAVARIFGRITRMFFGSLILPAWAEIIFIPVLLIALSLIKPVRQWAKANRNVLIFSGLAVFLYLVPTSIIGYDLDTSRYLYQPAIYASIAIGLAAGALLRGSRRRVAVAATVLALVAVAFSVLHRMEIQEQRKTAFREQKTGRDFKTGKYRRDQQEKP
ncbi:MAG: hypothetical protein E3J72_07120 [Planctomycetota bacterium]|nr:MAG: hypothetical protein E3J72_07120 [Planctomycetota bacterium]